MDKPNNSKLSKIENFDPDGVGSTTSGIFGLPFNVTEADVVIIPVPWDVTVSNMEGTAMGPANIFEQSSQIDLYDDFVKEPWKAGIAMEEISPALTEQNNLLRIKAREYIDWLEEKGSIAQNPKLTSYKNEINEACSTLTRQIKEKTEAYLEAGKLPVLLGGDHSTPLGMMQAIADKYDDFGVLQIDAHADLRPAYEGFTHSHASIIYNALEIPQISSFVQVGLRDFCKQEADLMASQPNRIAAFFARNIHQRGFRGESWKSICDDIIAKLPQKVYITIDIDGLDPALCPTTGTPVPGGLSYDQLLFLFEEVVNSGRQIIGFDLVETGPGQIDGIIACRILYKTIAMMLKSNAKV